MLIQIGEKEFDLRTNLGVVKKLEKKFKRPLTTLLAGLEDATVDEMIAILSYGLGEEQAEQAAELVASIENEMDYATIWAVLQEFVISLMFSGTPEQKESKIAKSNFDEPQKNAFRGLLGLPLKEIPTEDIAEPNTSTPES